MAREPDSLSVSTWPRRRWVENSSPSYRTTSASVAPDFRARSTTSCASWVRSVAAMDSVCMCGGYPRPYRLASNSNDGGQSGCREFWCDIACSIVTSALQESMWWARQGVVVRYGDHQDEGVD